MDYLASKLIFSFAGAKKKQSIIRSAQLRSQQTCGGCVTFFELFPVASTWFEMNFLPARLKYEISMKTSPFLKKSNTGGFIFIFDNIVVRATPPIASRARCYLFAPTSILRFWCAPAKYGQKDCRLPGFSCPALYALFLNLFSLDARFYITSPHQKRLLSCCCDTARHPASLSNTERRYVYASGGWRVDCEKWIKVSR